MDGHSPRPETARAARPAAPAKVTTTSPSEIVATTAVEVTAPLLRARDVAELFNLSANTVLDWFERGQLPGFKINGGPVRFSRVELEEWLAAQHREAVG